MNQIELQTKRNNIRRLFRHQSGIHTNCIRLNAGSTQAHEETKFKICLKLLREGKEFICEAETHDKKCRPDIVCLDDGQIIEIYEELKKLNKKGRPL